MKDGVTRIRGRARDKVAQSHGWACHVCGSPENLEVHHKVPWRFLKSNAGSNLVALCRKCHRILHRNNNDPGPEDLALLIARGIDRTVMPVIETEPAAVAHPHPTPRLREPITACPLLAPPLLGEIRRGRDIGKQHGGKHVWTLCPSCLQHRWVPFQNSRSKTQRCGGCTPRVQPSRPPLFRPPPSHSARSASGRKGGLTTLRRHGKAAMTEWGRLGGRPRNTEGGVIQ